MSQTSAASPGVFGVADGSYRAAGELAGITRLVDAFYDFMEQLPEAQSIRARHPTDLTESRLKLRYFLSGWLGGPKLYAQHFGPIHIPRAHQHLKATAADKDAWLLCMARAVALQPYSDEFKHYLLAQLRVPAERIVAAGSA